MSQKTILITGGARRLGAIITSHFAKQNYNIAIHYNSSEEDAKALEEQLAGVPVKIKFYQGDLNNISFVKSLIETVKKDFGTIDILINNASIFQKRSFLDTSENEFDQYLNIHLKAPFFLAQAFAKNTENGHIINITDTRISRRKTVFFPYLLSKKSLSEFSSLLATELAPQIYVNEICPGKILPSINPSEDIPSDVLKDKLPTKELATPEQIIQAIEYILNSKPIGQKFFIDGGESLVS